MAMLPGDYKRRRVTAQLGANIGAGTANDPVMVTGDGNPHKVVPATGVLTVLSVMATSTSGVNMWFQDSAGTKQMLISDELVSRDYRLHFYCPWDLWFSSDVPLLVICYAPSKGNTTD